MEPSEDEVDFPFPFPPYDIQKKFMRGLYKVLREKKLGIFESPTGTGKSLSMCCGALTWLKLHEEAEIQHLTNEISRLHKEICNMPSNEDWLAAEYEKMTKTQELNRLRTKLEDIKQRKMKFQHMKVRVEREKKNLSTNNDISFRDMNKDKVKDVDKQTDDMEKDQDDDEELVKDEVSDKDDSSEDEEKMEHAHVQIYIGSRTHSQLSQLVGEIRRTEFATSARVVTLASRRHYCINQQVAKLKNLSLINEKCLDLQKSKSKKTQTEDGRAVKKSKSCGGCPYYNAGNIERLKERLLVDMMDVEELGEVARRMKACPYYATRAAVPQAQVVLVSHAGVVSAGARAGVSLRLHGNVLLLDEAHGLGAALEQAHAAPLSRAHVHAALRWLSEYTRHYGGRLSSKNLLALNQIIFVLTRLKGIISKPSETNSDPSQVYTLEEFLIAAEIDHMNLRPLVEFCRTSRLAQKVHGFSSRPRPQQAPPTRPDGLRNLLSAMTDKNSQKPSAELQSQENPAVQWTEESAGTAVYALISLLEMLCERSELGRVLVLRDSLIKYLLLDPTQHFATVVRECRSVVLAGGTMQPISEFESLLGCGEGSPRAEVVQCEHVVPSENVLAVALSKGPTGVALNFTYSNRNNVQLLEETGRVLRNVVNAVPGGVVVFVSSYAFEEALYRHLDASRVLQQIAARKKIFREPKSSTLVDKVLCEYSSGVRCRDAGNTGAVLFSVVGGKLSEGLNFSDDLGRCVMVVGVPFANAQSAELRHKLEHVKRARGPAAAAEHYQNLAIKAVNQCIGRAVRHAKDYACVLLLDERFSRESISSSLPGFIRHSLTTDANFPTAFAAVASFFKNKRAA